MHALGLPGYPVRGTFSKHIRHVSSADLLCPFEFQLTISLDGVPESFCSRESLVETWGKGEFASEFGNLSQITQRQEEYGLS